MIVNASIHGNTDDIFQAIHFILEINKFAEEKWTFHSGTDLL